MKNGTPTYRVFMRMGWFLGSGGMLLLLSAGLEFFARQTVEQASFATILELLYLAFWSYVLGVVILLLMPIVVCVMWLRDRLGHRAMEPDDPGRSVERTTAPAPQQSLKDRVEDKEPSSLTHVA